MGRSPSIEELAEKDEAFKNYLATQRTDIEKQADAIKLKLDTEIEEYYTEGGWDDKKPFISGTKIDVQHVKEWSLNNINNILSALETAIFGGTPVPEGTEIEREAIPTKSIIEMTNLELLVLSRAFETVQSILQTFSISTNVSFMTEYKTTQISPGLTLFSAIRTNSFSSSSYFNDEKITQYYYIFKVYFSAKQAGDIAKFNAIQAYMDLLTAWTSKIRELADLIEETPLTDFSRFTELAAMQKYFADELEGILDKIRELANQEKAARLEMRAKKMQAFQKQASLSE